MGVQAEPFRPHPDQTLPVHGFISEASGISAFHSGARFLDWLVDCAFVGDIHEGTRLLSRFHLKLADLADQLVHASAQNGEKCRGKTASTVWLRDALPAEA